MPEKSHAELTEAELDAELDVAIADRRVRGLPPQLVADLARATDRTVPISVRLPSQLLEELRAEAARHGIGYQTLLVRLVDAGLAGRSSVPARVRVPVEAVRAGHLVLDVELVET